MCFGAAFTTLGKQNTSVQDQTKRKLKAYPSLTENGAARMWAMTTLNNNDTKIGAFNGYLIIYSTFIHGNGASRQDNVAMEINKME